MENRKYYSFERNNYYYGKMLTSRDFQNEQSYMNDKRRLGNRLFQGSGIVYGLDVVAADDPVWLWIGRDGRLWSPEPRC